MGYHQHMPGDLGQNHQLPQAWRSCCSENKGRWLSSSHSTAFPEALLQSWVKHNHVASAGRQTWPEPEGEDMSTPHREANCRAGVSNSPSLGHTCTRASGRAPMPRMPVRGWYSSHFCGYLVVGGWRSSVPLAFRTSLASSLTAVSCLIALVRVRGQEWAILCAKSSPRSCGADTAWHQCCPRHSVPQCVPSHRPVAHSPEAGDSTPTSSLSSRGLWRSQPCKALLPARAAGATLCPSNLTRLQLLRGNIQGP